MAYPILDIIVDAVDHVRFWVKPRALGLGRINISTVAKDPTEQFGLWYKQAARRSWPRFPYIMSLATIDDRGFPNSRMVGLVKFGPEGFEFNSAFSTAKSKELDATPRAALTFYWEALNRQVRIQGSTQKLSETEAEAYFRGRDRFQQIFEWVQIQQSQPMEPGQSLEQKYNEYEQKFKGKEVPRPDNFGGYRVVPNRIEFLQFGLSWLTTDRIVYLRKDDGSWEIKRLYP